MNGRRLRSRQFGKPILSSQLPKSLARIGAEESAKNESQKLVISEFPKAMLSGSQTKFLKARNR